MPTEKLKQTLIEQLNSLQGAGINAIIFQVRPEADALYASSIEPWSPFLNRHTGSGTFALLGSDAVYDRRVS